MVDETSPVLEAAKRPDYRVTFERLSDSMDALYQDVVVLLKLLFNVFVDLFVDSLAHYRERGVPFKKLFEPSRIQDQFSKRRHIELRMVQISQNNTKDGTKVSLPISFVIPVSK